MAPPKDYRACLSSYLVLILPLFIPLGISLLAFCSTNHASLLWPIFFCVLAIGYLFLWLSRFRLRFSSKTIKYRSLYSGEVSLLRSDIESVRFASKTGVFESPFTLIVRTTTGAEVRINAKVFPAQAVQDLMQ
jgi:hypothetical protein